MIKDTPIENHKIKSFTVMVKREDKCVSKPGPPFSKVRGILEHMKMLKSKGVKTVGYTETSISMAGWGVAWVCSLLGMKAVIFDPQYKKTPKVLKYHRKQWDKFKPDIIPIKAGMARVNWNISKNLLRDKYGPHAILLPLGLPFPETIIATAKEVLRTMINVEAETIVVNVGSGTICAGVLKGIEEMQISRTVIGIMGRTGDMERKRKTILNKAELTDEGIFCMRTTFILIDPGWEYTDKSEEPCPFPCHPYYDRKAWQWLVENIEVFPHPVIFWNIGK